jgi:hypothetical protein
MKTPNPRWEEAVRDSFARQTLIATIGASLLRVEPGAVDIELPFRADLTQQSGTLHAGVLATTADSARKTMRERIERDPGPGHGGSDHAGGVPVARYGLRQTGDGVAAYDEQTISACGGRIDVGAYYR